MQALSIKNKDKAVITIDSLGIKQGKVKETLKALATAKVAKTENTLLIVKEKDNLTLRATSNIANLKVVRPTYLNVFDLMNADKVVIVKDALNDLESWLLGKENK